jgi:ABC-type sugar transport system substrate-binding protein
MTGTTNPIRSFRRPLAVALALGAAIALAACSTPAPNPSAGSSSGSTEKALRIGFSPFSLQVPALKGLADGLTAVAKAQGDTVLTVDPKGDPSTQLQQLQQWVSLGQVDAIWTIPLAAPAIKSALVAAQAKGIVVLASGVPSDYGFSGPQAGITFSNVDNAAYGKSLGELASKCINDRLGGKGNIIFLQSPSGAASSGLINDAVKAAITAGSPNAKVVNTQDAKPDRLGNTTVVSSALQGAPDANVAIGADDESTLGGLDAFTAAGLTTSNSCVLGAGGGTEAQADVKSGKLYGDVAFNFQADMIQNLKELHKLALDPKKDGSQLVTPIQVITK